MPAFVNRRFGESGIRLDDWTIECCFDLKKSRNDWRTWAEFMGQERGWEGVVLTPSGGKREGCFKGIGDRGWGKG
jgi:hypothetical protein